MKKYVILHEDDRDLAQLVIELLEEQNYSVIHVQDIEQLLVQAALHSPCVALVDGNSPTEFDLWPLGEKLAKLGVPPVAFTAHASARQRFATSPSGYIGVLLKPFDADEFVEVVNGICWEEHQAEAS